MRMTMLGEYNGLSWVYNCYNCRFIVDVERVQNASTISSSDRRMIKQFRLAVERLGEQLNPALTQLGNCKLRTKKEVWNKIQPF